MNPRARDFEKFHALNGWVYEAFSRIMDSEFAKRSEGSRYSARLACQRVSFHNVRTTSTDPKVTGDPETFKLTNEHSVFYARMWVMEHPERREFLRINRSNYADDWPGPPGWPFSGTPVRGGKDPGVGPYGRGPGA